MSEHIDSEGRFQSDKYPSTPPDLVPLKVTDPDARDLLATYAERRRKVDSEFADDLLSRLAETGPTGDRSGTLPPPPTSEELGRWGRGGW